MFYTQCSSRSLLFCYSALIFCSLFFFQAEDGIPYVGVTGVQTCALPILPLADEGAVLGALRGLSQHASIDEVECLWQPYMLLAARIREVFGLPGMTVEQTVPFRDKEQMKRVLDAAGIRTDRKSTRLNSSHANISYAVFCLKKKNK